MTLFYIFLGLSVLFEALVAWKYFETLFDKKLKTTKSLLFVLLGYTILFITSIFSNSYVNAISFIIINFLILFYIYDINTISNLFHSFILTVSMIITEVLFLILIKIIFNEVNIYFENTYVTLILAIISKLFYFIIIQLFIYVFDEERETATNNNLGTLGLWIIPFSTIFMTSSFFYMLVYYNIPQTGSYLFLIISVLFLFANIFVFITYCNNQKINKKYTETKIALQKEKTDQQFYKMLDEQQQKQKLFLHDTKNHLYLINNYLEENNIKKACEYLHKIQQSSALRNKVDFSENHTLNLILSRYYDIFSKENLVVNFTILSGLNFIADEDLTSLFGNLFDNIYEAITDIEHANIDLLIKPILEDNTITIRIINSCKNELVIKNNNLLSTKANKYEHGYGTKIICDIVKKYNGSYNFYSKKNYNQFHTFITVPIKNINL